MPDFAGPRIELRQDRHLDDDDLMLIRLHVGEINQVIKQSLNFWAVYRPVLRQLRRPGGGALTLSVFGLVDGLTVTALAAGTTYRSYRQVRYGILRSHSIEVWPTNVYLNGTPHRLNRAHFDVLVTDDAEIVPDKSCMVHQRSVVAHGQHSLRPSNECSACSTHRWGSRTYRRVPTPVGRMPQEGGARCRRR